MITIAFSVLSFIPILAKKNKKALAKRNKEKNHDRRRSSEKIGPNGDDMRAKMVERGAKRETHKEIRDDVMAAAPSIEKEKSDKERLRIQAEKQLAEKLKQEQLEAYKEEVQQAPEIKKELPRSYQKEIEKKRSSSSSSEEAAARASSPTQPIKKKPSIAHSSSESRSRSRERMKSRSLSPKRRKRSPSPVATKIHVGNLTRNVNKEHIIEIFFVYGKVRHVEIPVNRSNFFQRPHAYIEFENASEAEKAVKHMDGGWIDGQEVKTKLVLPMKERRRSPPGRFAAANRRRSPPHFRRPYRGMNRRSRSGSRPRRRSRSRSPPRGGNIRRRRQSSSSASSRSRSPMRRGPRPRSKSASISRRRRFSRSSTSS